MGLFKKKNATELYLRSMAVIEKLIDNGSIGVDIAIPLIEFDALFYASLMQEKKKLIAVFDKLRMYINFKRAYANGFSVYVRQRIKEAKGLGVNTDEWDSIDKKLEMVEQEESIMFIVRKDGGDIFVHGAVKGNDIVYFTEKNK